MNLFARTMTRNVTRHLVLSRWDRWTACGLALALHSGKKRPTSGQMGRVSCLDCLRAARSRP